MDQKTIAHKCDVLFTCVQTLEGNVCTITHAYMWLVDYVVYTHIYIRLKCTISKVPFSALSQMKTGRGLGDLSL